ncbi:MULTISPECIES: DJ-1/PfpI family protein [Halomicrobium]|uniref:ThiJ/PfpI domain protein n=2 Tax=Halomicrobium mukohataei TaxID=57705 RepID=C7P159_HALMD|nr:MULTISPECIES: DJ-1/PfpI family protein [Halomicrobium]ACV49074.1 ThiJ/PfpI domain protein [Halomicrobium mukohataei DSM 12286]QCD64491.1 DJ-1/PfpI family protein [Halomicrobium mukohataei]QFR19297.1 DJ-1/PfpI family protein [Halomicrobium sp. ZPS1]
MPDAAVLLFDGVESLDAVGPYDVLARAIESDGALADVALVTATPTESVTASKGTEIVPHGTLDAEDPPDYLLVPGGRWASGTDGGVRAAVERGVVPDLVADCHAAGSTVAAVCTGAMVLARAGLLDGRPAVTHASALSDLAATDATVVDARVVDDGDVLTAGGVTAGIDLALWLVEREWGTGVAERVRTTLEYDRSDDIYRSESV